MNFLLLSADLYLLKVPSNAHLRKQRTRISRWLCNLYWTEETWSAVHGRCALRNHHSPLPMYRPEPPNNYSNTWVRTKHGPGVHRPPPWTGSMDHFHGPGPWTPCHGRGLWTVFFKIMRNEQKQKKSKNKIKNNNNNKQYSIDQYYSMHDFYLMPKCCLFLWIVSSDGWIMLWWKTFWLSKCEFFTAYSETCIKRKPLGNAVVFA